MRFLLGFIIGLLLGGLAAIILESQRAAAAAEADHGPATRRPTTPPNPAE